MKNSAYKAPDGFFEEFESSIIKETAAIRAGRTKILISSLALIVVLVGFALFPSGGEKHHNEDLMAGAGKGAKIENYCEDEEILNIYEYDIFLNSYQL